MVMVAPSDATLVTGGSEERRRMMDIIISQYDSQYLSALIRYNKALQQRNSLLKQEDSAPIDMLELYEQMMVQESRVIVSSRIAFVQQMVPVFNELYARIGGNSEVVSLSYNSVAWTRIWLNCMNVGDIRNGCGIFALRTSP